jgi:two-component system NtrC family sensor kinase
MKRSNTMYMLSVILLLIVGLGATTYLAMKVRNNATKNWINQSFQQSEQITNIFLSWLDKENETFKGLASLFYGTEDIAQEEFATSVAVIEQTELSIRQLSIAFVSKAREDKWVVGLAAGSEDLWQANLPLPENVPSTIPINQTVNLALNAPERPIIGPVFTSKTGAHMVIVAFVVVNSDEQGVLMSAVNLDTLLRGINDLHVPTGLQFSLNFGSNDQLNFATDFDTQDIIATKNLRVMGVDKEWRFVWSVDGNYLGGPDTSMSTAIGFGGIVISLLIAMVIWIQAKQNEKITQKVIEKTSQLKSAQEQLVQSEKMASLGSLVAGVSHELNTPIGIALTASTSLLSMTRDLRTQLNNNTLKKSSLNNYFDQACSATELVESNINRATELITSFKQVAVDQTSERRRRFNLKSSIEDVIKTLTPKIKNTTHVVTIEIQEGIEMHSYPGPLGQVLTNFITNTLIHGFEDMEDGMMKIIGYRDHDNIVLEYSDNGCGIEAKNLPKIFDPFYTSKLGKGGSGLGLNVVYNLCTGILGGEVEVVSAAGDGITFTLTLPLEAA